MENIQFGNNRLPAGPKSDWGNHLERNHCIKAVRVIIISSILPFFFVEKDIICAEISQLILIAYVKYSSTKLVSMSSCLDKRSDLDS